MKLAWCEPMGRYVNRDTLVAIKIGLEHEEKLLANEDMWKESKE